MNNSQGALYFGAGIDMTQWRNSINEMRRDIFSLNNSVQQEARNIDSAFKNLSLGIAGYFSARSLLGFTKELINVRGEFQKTEIAFTTMLGNGEQAKSLMDQMVNLAAKTPFSLQDVSAGAKQLLAFQIPADQVVDTLTRMGNIAAGLSIPLSRINLVYGQVKAKGKLMGDDLRQFTEAGIPMVAELAKKFNKSTAEISAMVSAGKIGFKDVKDVLFAMTNEGGMFFNLMEKQSASLSGKISNLEDAWDQMLNKIGESQEGLISKGIDGLAYLVEHYEEVLRVITTLIAAYGTYRAVLITVAVAQRALAIATFIKEYLAMARALGMATANMIAFNTATLANPYTLAAAGIAAVVAALVYFNTGSSEAKNNAEKMAQAVNSATASVGKESLELRKLYNAATDEKKSRKERTEAVKELQRLYPSYFGNLSKEIIMTGKAKANYDELRDAIIASARARAIGTELERREGERLAEEAELQEKLDEATRRRQENLKKGYKDQYISIGGGSSTGGVASGQTYKSTAAQQYKNDLKAQSEAQENLNAFRNKALKEDEFYIKEKIKLDEKASKYNKDKERDTDIVAGGAKKGTQRWYEEEVRRLEEANKELVPQSKEWLKNIATIQRYNDLIRVKSSSNNKQLAESYPLGSIKELERRKKLLRDALDSESGDSIRIRKVDKYGQERDKKGNPYYTGEVVSRQKAGEMLAKIEDEINKKQTKSFEERLNETKRQIEVRDKLIQQGYSKEYVDGMFPDVKDTSFLEYLDKLSEKLAKTNGKEAAENLIKVRDITTEYTGEKTFIDSVNEQIEKLKSKFSGNELIEKLENLKKANLEGTTENNRNEKNKLLNKAQEDERIRIEANYNQLLNDHKSFEEKKAKITKDLNDALSLAQNDSERDKIKKAYGEQLSALTVEAFRASKDWELAFSNIEYVSRSTAERVVKQLIEWRDANKNTLNPQDYKIVSDKIEEFQRKAVSAFSVQPIITSWRNYRKAAEDTEKAEQELEEANKELALSFIKLMAASSMSAEDAKKALEEYNISTEKAKKAKEKLDQQQSTKDSFLNNLKKDFSNWGDKTSQIVNQVEGAISSVEGIVTDLGGSLDNEFGDALEKMKGVLEGVSQIADGMKEFATGGPVGMVTGSIKMIGGLIKSIGSMFNNDKKKERAIKREAEALKELKSAYEDLAYAANKALGSDKYDAEKRSLQNIRDQQARLREMYRIEGDKKKSDSGKMDEYKEQIKSLDRQYQDLVDSIAKDFLQTDAKDMASQLTEGLVEALSKGESALDSLDKKANDVFANMAKAWVRSRLEKSMGDIFDKMLAESGVNKDGTGTFNPLSSDRMNYYKELMKNAGLEQQKFLEQYKEFFQDANSSPKGLEGAIKGVSEETASLIAGQMNAIRINQGKMLEMQDKSSAVMRESLIQLSKIEFNTSRLHSIDKNMAELNSKITNNNGLRGSGL
ncbi:tape measure protein [Elizabethkingia anophelis]|nr:tape measure protein [Elizabethkingia anophelis]